MHIIYRLEELAVNLNVQINWEKVHWFEENHIAKHGGRFDVLIKYDERMTVDELALRCNPDNEEICGHYYPDIPEHLRQTVVYHRPIFVDAFIKEIEKNSHD